MRHDSTISSISALSGPCTRQRVPAPERLSHAAWAVRTARGVVLALVLPRDLAVPGSTGSGGTWTTTVPPACTRLGAPDRGTRAARTRTRRTTAAVRPDRATRPGRQLVEARASG
jgi:hypothetical protein